MGDEHGCASPAGLASLCKSYGVIELAGLVKQGSGIRDGFKEKWARYLGRKFAMRGKGIPNTV